MATWDITVSAGSTVGSGTDVLLTTISGVVPGDFDGSTIDSVVVQGTPTVTSDGVTDDTIGVRFFVTTSTPADTFGGDGSDAASMCYASVGDSASSANITDGSSRSPNPTTAVAADWDEVRYSINYAANMKNDGETISWSSFTVRVTYTPAAKTADGTPSIPLPTASGTAERILTATGASSIAIPTASGSAKFELPASGAPSIPLPTASGSGSVTSLPDQTATGAPSLPIPTTSGDAIAGRKANGAVSLSVPTVSGAAVIIKTSSGAVTLPLLTASGSAKMEWTANGSPSIPLPTASGSATIIKTSDGSPAIALVTASGTSVVIKTATGSPSIPLLTASGVANVGTVASGATTIAAITASGSATKTGVAGAGDAKGPGFVMGTGRLM